MSTDGKNEIVFDDLLEQATKDDTDAGWGERETPVRDLDWYLRETPPHHGE
jgi:hypothetical protein